MSYLLDITIPMTWSAIQDQYTTVNQGMNHIAFTLLEQDDGWNLDSEMESGTDLQRLEHKVDLVIQLLSQLLHDDGPVPKPIPVHLGASQISWYDADVKVGSRYQLKLYLNPRTHIPVEVIVQIRASEAGWCHGEIETTRTDELAAWEKWVFRQHRRQIATSRQHAKR